MTTFYIRTAQYSNHMQIKKNAIDVDDDDGKEAAKKNFFDFLLTQQKKLFLQTAAECSSSGGKININQWQFAI